MSDLQIYRTISRNAFGVFLMVVAIWAAVLAALWHFTPSGEASVLVIAVWIFFGIVVIIASTSDAIELYYMPLRLEKYVVMMSDSSFKRFRSYLDCHIDMSHRITRQYAQTPVYVLAQWLREEAGTTRGAIEQLDIARGITPKKK